MTKSPSPGDFAAFESTDLTAADRRDFAREMVAAARLWRNRLSERLKSFGLTPPAWAALHGLSLAEGGISQTVLADRAGIEPATLVRTLDLLEKQGLVERRACATDRRINLLHLTDAGRPVVGQIEKVADEVRHDAMAGIDSDAIRTALEVLRKLRSRLD